MVARPSELPQVQRNAHGRQVGSAGTASGAGGYNGAMATDPEDRPKYDAKRIQRRGLLVFLALLPIAALIGAGVVDRPFSWADWALATLAADIIICLIIGGASLFVGLAVSLSDRDSEVGKTFMGFGASLAVIFFEGIALAGILYKCLHSS